MDEILIGILHGGKTNREFEIWWRSSKRGGHYDIINKQTGKTELDRPAPAHDENEAMERARQYLEDF